MLSLFTHFLFSLSGGVIWLTRSFLGVEPYLSQHVCGCQHWQTAKLRVESRQVPDRCLYLTSDCQIPVWIFSKLDCNLFHPWWVIVSLRHWGAHETSTGERRPHSGTRQDVGWGLWNTTHTSTYEKSLAVWRTEPCDVAIVKRIRTLLGDYCFMAGWD